MRAADDQSPNPPSQRLLALTIAFTPVKAAGFMLVVCMRDLGALWTDSRRLPRIRSSDKDGIYRCCIRVRIQKLDVVPGCGTEYLSEMFGEVFADGIVGPKREGSAGFELMPHGRETVCRVEGPAFFREKMSGRVVDVEQHRVELSFG